MASPFKFFRKRRRVMLAGLGVLAMFGFVILPAMMQALQVLPGANPVVATSKYGKLTYSRLMQLRARRKVVIEFLLAVRNLVWQANGNYQYADWVLRRIGADDDESIVTAWILANRAQEMGIVVDEDLINQFLSDITQGKVSEEDIRVVLRRLGTNEAYLFEVLHDELLALRMRDLLAMSIGASTPGQRWEYFRRVNQRATIEAAVIPVEAFVDRVTESPSESELKQFFDQYRYEVDNPLTPEPGFLQPRRVRLEYLMADYSKFIDQVEVSDEEIERYYNENKDVLYLKQPLPQLPEEKAQQQQGPEHPEQNERQPVEKDESQGKQQVEGVSSSEQNESEQQESPQQTDESETTPSAPDTSQNSQEPSGESSTIGESSDEQPAGEAEKAPESSSLELDETSEEKQPANVQDEQSRNFTAGAFHFVSLQQSGSKQPEQAEAEQPEGKEQSGDHVEAAATEASGQQSDKRAESAEPTAAEEQQQKPKPEYIPLEEVRDEIRRILARRKAPEKMRSLLEKLQTQFDHYYNQQILYEVEKERNQSAKPPERPDLKKLAEQYGLTAGDTGLVSRFELQEGPLANCMLLRQGIFIDYVLEKLPVFRTVLAQDYDGNMYLVWKTEEEEQKVLSFDDPGVKEKVLRTWKMIKARQLALREAERIAQEAAQAKKTLREYLGANSPYEIVETPPFSWLTQSPLTPYSSFVPAQISQVPGIDHPGEEFMEAVFRRKAGEYGAALNYPQTMAYAFRVIEVNPTEDVLWQQFVSVSSAAYASVFQREYVKMQSRLIEQIRNEAKFQWSPDWQRERLRDAR